MNSTRRPLSLLLLPVVLLAGAACEHRSPPHAAAADAALASLELADGNTTFDRVFWAKEGKQATPRWERAVAYCTDFVHRETDGCMTVLRLNASLQLERDAARAAATAAAVAKDDPGVSFAPKH